MKRPLLLACLVCLASCQRATARLLRGGTSHQLKASTPAAPPADAAALAGLADPGQALVPDLLREAARTLAAVADENAEREDGFYAGDRARLLARLDADPAHRTSTRESIVVRPRVAEAGPCEPACTAVALAAADPLLVVGGRLTRSDPAATERVTRAVEPTPLAVAAVAPERTAPPESAPTPVIAPAVEPAVERAVAPTAPAEAPDAHDRKAVLPEAAVEPVAPRQRRRRDAPRRVERRPVRSEETERLRRLASEQYLDLTLEEGFALMRDISSKGGTDASWMRNSVRGFDAAGTLALSFFGRQTRVRDMSLADCRGFVEALGSVPENWGKSAALTAPMSELIAMANDKEEAKLLDVERQAEAEAWSDEQFLVACAAAREERLSPGTQYKHQCYVAGVVKTVFRLAKAGEHPMKEAIWKKKYLNQLKAEAGPQRLPLGPEGRAALFSRPIFTAGPAEADDPLFWEPLLARYAGLRMQEGLQLKPKDFGVEDGIPVIFIRASSDQFLKSIHAARKLLVHPELIRLGLLRLVERKRREGARWVFDVERGLDGTFSSAFSKVYYNWRVSEGIYEPGKDFHSIRKDFYQSMKSAKVDYAARVVLMGHALNDVSETNYGMREWEIEELRDFIYAIPADTSHVRPLI